MSVNAAAQPLASLNTTLSSNASPAKIKKAAEDFEALLIGQMLKSVRESSTSGWGNSEQAGGAALDLAEQQIAQMIAANGGLGLARLISSGLTHSQKQDKPTPSASKS
jgi:peptidoglycan hydrolase FlgJ